MKSAVCCVNRLLRGISCSRTFPRADSHDPFGISACSPSCSRQCETARPYLVRRSHTVRCRFPRMPDQVVSVTVLARGTVDLFRASYLAFWRELWLGIGSRGGVPRESCGNIGKRRYQFAAFRNSGISSDRGLKDGYFISLFENCADELRCDKLFAKDVASDRRWSIIASVERPQVHEFPSSRGLGRHPLKV